MEFAVCVGDFENPERLAQRLAEEGVTALEAGPRLFTEKDDETIKEVARTLRGYGIRIFSVHAPFGKEENLSALEEDVRSKAVETHKNLLSKIALADAEVMIVHPGTHASDEEIPRMEELLVSTLGEVVREAERVGVKVALENMLPAHPGHLSSVIREVVETISSPNLGVCFDTGHAHVNEEGEIKAFETVKDLIIAFHLQDNDSTRDMHLQPPYGTVDWVKLVEMINGMGFKSPMTVEAAPWQGASFKQMLREVESVFRWGMMEVELDGKSMRVICPRCGRYVFKDENGWFCGCQEV